MAASCAPLILYGRKMKLLEVMRILERETDAELALTANRIADRLEEKGFPHVDRKGVYDDINVLNGFLKPGGGDGCKRPRIEKDEISFGYYLDNRYFSVADLRLIIDALLSSSFFRRSHPDIPTNLAWLASRIRRSDALRIQWGDLGFDTCEIVQKPNENEAFVACFRGGNRHTG